MGWNNRDMLGFDLETTGVDPTRDRIVMSSLIRVGLRGVVDKEEWLVDPGVEIPEAAAAVHGITTERARAEGVAPAEAIDDIVHEINRVCGTGRIPLVAYNGAYDLSILHREAVRHGTERPSPGLRMLDPMVLDKRLDRYRRGRRTLVAVSDHYQIPLPDAHDSTGDALAACRVLWKIGRRHPWAERLPLDRLHDLQRQWYWEQKDNMEEYLRRVKGDDSITLDRSWPLIPITAEERLESRGPLGRLATINSPTWDALAADSATVRCGHNGTCKNPTRAGNRRCWRHGAAA